MIIEYIESSDFHALTQALENKVNSTKAFIVLGADANQWPESDLDNWLKNFDVPVFGAVFPQVIYDKHNYEVGAVIISLQVDVPWKTVNALSDEGIDFDDVIADTADDWESEEEATMMVFVDGMASRIATLIESLFFNFGLERNIIGGGAGSLSFQQAPCILSPNGYAQDTALLLLLPFSSGIGVGHGWEPISEPLKVTKSDKNVILQLDYEDAFDKYRSIVEQQSQQQFNDDNFFDIAKSYPFGIVKLDAEMVVRDPLMPTEDGIGLVCVGEVPEDCFVKVLNGTPKTLIDAAGEVKQQAISNWSSSNEQPPQAAFFIDCISRVLFLEAQMAEEIAQVSGAAPLFGAFTLGEIANSGQDYLEFYNKTAVVCALGSTA